MFGTFNLILSGPLKYKGKLNCIVMGYTHTCLRPGNTNESN